VSARWGAPSDHPTLEPDDVHVWFASLDRHAPELAQFMETLSEEERARAARFHFERDRRWFIVGRALLRAILGHYLALPTSRLAFRYNSSGKPALTGVIDRGGLRFNLSHSAGRALYAVAHERAIGVDLEYIRPLSDVDAMAERIFSPREKVEWRMLPADERLAAFFRCWTRKEAYIKAVGDGFSIPVDRFDVSIGAAEPGGLLLIDGDPEGTSRWTLQDLDPHPSYAAALAVEGGGWRLACWRWPSPAREVVTS
jgi:4'-phosphopantetheinyl transferase